MAVDETPTVRAPRSAGYRGLRESIAATVESGALDRVFGTPKPAPGPADDVLDEVGAGIDAMGSRQLESAGGSRTLQGRIQSSLKAASRDRERHDTEERRQLVGDREAAARVALAGMSVEDRAAFEVALDNAAAERIIAEAGEPPPDLAEFTHYEEDES